MNAVLIDEAQDWPCSWFQCARQALREPETGDLMMQPITVSQAGFHLGRCRHQCQWRVINRKFDLDRNYRNTVEILRAARAFSVPSVHDLRGVHALPIERGHRHPLRS